MEGWPPSQGVNVDQSKLHSNTASLISEWFKKGGGAGTMMPS